jgi:hypothetical protein
MNRSTSRFTCEAVPDPDRRAFFTHTAMAAAAGVAAAQVKRLVDRFMALPQARSKRQYLVETR